MQWQAIYEMSRSQTDRARGYYNKNIRVAVADEVFNVRIPLEGAEPIDVRLWDEAEILSAIQGKVASAPQLRYASDFPRYQVHDFIEGTVLDDYAPRGARVPDHIMHDVVSLISEMSMLPEGSLPELPAGWPKSGDSTGFGLVLSDWTLDVYRRFQKSHAYLFESLGIPRDPVDGVARRWTDLTPRDYQLVHADLHRKNIIVQRGGAVFIDWEFALWGDPVYEMAVHLHKMDYPDGQRADVLAAWAEALRDRLAGGWRNDIAIYLDHERVKSAIVDTVRYSKAFASSDATPERIYLARRLRGKINAARPVWGCSPDVTEEAVWAVLSNWSTITQPFPGAGCV